MSIFYHRDAGDGYVFLDLGGAGHSFRLSRQEIAALAADYPVNPPPEPKPTRAQLDYPLVCAECGAYLVKVPDTTVTARHVLQHLISGPPCSKSGKTFEPIIFELKEIVNKP